MQSTIPDLSWNKTEKLLKSPPDIDHIVLFYVPLHMGCRQFINLFSTLSQQFAQDGKEVKFVKVDCSGAILGNNLCHRYNVSHVPTVAYVSQFEFQREKLPPHGPIQRSLRWSISSMMEDINAVHATCYKGDLFVYQELLDWATLMYNISRFKRWFDRVFVGWLSRLGQLLSP
ncbi:disulfide-isomerase A3, putative [Babesia ovis]|uniref:Disulfide-isomerase A3, putative n=1 Tax=Babesia ovis TaxID=5869 RepID=A0A9W5WV71_BABOV|nr:disulfide-isomerase A3, putative [Babesia ovis]